MPVPGLRLILGFVGPGRRPGERVRHHAGFVRDPQNARDPGPRRRRQMGGSQPGHCLVTGFPPGEKGRGPNETTGQEDTEKVPPHLIFRRTKQPGSTLPQKLVTFRGQNFSIND